MAFFYGLNSNSSSSFFNSMMGTGSNNAFSSSLYNSLGDYMSIRSGSYGRLVRAYYAEQEGDTKTSSAKKTNTDTKTNTKTNDTTRSQALSSLTGKTAADSKTLDQKAYAETKTEANALKTDATDLLTKGSKSVFKQTDVKDGKTGLTTKQYNTDNIYNAVKKLTDDYNSLITSAGKSSNTAIQEKGAKLAENVASYEKKLADLGITINKDHTLSIDENKFKAGNMSAAKDLFNNYSSLGGEVAQSASEIENLASSSAASNALYNNNASYNALTGSLFSDYT